MSSKNILVTSSRMPFALDEIRKFGRRGHAVYASDTFSTSPGSHSQFVAEQEPPPLVLPVSEQASVKVLFVA